MAQSLLESFKEEERHVPLEEEKRAMEELQSHEDNAEIFDETTDTKALEGTGKLKEMTGMMKAKETLHKPSKGPAKTLPVVKDDLTKQVEQILEQDLGDAFDELTTIQKQEFKLEGERAAFEIRQLMRKTKVNVRKIFQVVVAWLRFLPGLNRFFVEQEAKIKADKIIALTRQPPQ